MRFAAALLSAALLSAPAFPRLAVILGYESASASTTIGGYL